MITAFDECKIRGHITAKQAGVANPRLQKNCGRCGRLLGADVLRRNVNLERDWTQRAATFAQYVADPEAAANNLSSMREKRMGEGPWVDASVRNWIEEALEETADLSAYLMAALTELDAQNRDDEDADRDRMLLFMALSASVTAFEALRAVEPPD